jgi:uncharacterized protein RhaS with RHS repeats
MSYIPYWLTYAYDATDGLTSVIYPDGMADVYTYGSDGPVWTYTHDADRRLTAVTDPMGNLVQLGYRRSLVLART